MSLIFYIHG